MAIGDIYFSKFSRFTIAKQYNNRKYGSIWWTLAEINERFIVVRAIDLVLGESFKTPTIESVLSLLRTNSSNSADAMGRLDVEIEERPGLNPENGRNNNSKRLYAETEVYKNYVGLWGQWEKLGSALEYLPQVQVNLNPKKAESKFQPFKELNNVDLLFGVTLGAKVKLSNVGLKPGSITGNPRVLWR